MAHSERIRVTYADIDVMDHVNNATYFTYMETARCRYYTSLTGIRDMRSIDIIVAAQSCQYLRGLRYDEEVDVVVWPSRVGNTSFTLSYAFRTIKGEIVALSDTVVVAFDYAKQTKKPIAERLRRMLESEMAKGPGFELPPRA